MHSRERHKDRSRRILQQMSLERMKSIRTAILVLFGALTIGCGCNKSDSGSSSDDQSQAPIVETTGLDGLSGTVAVDGSSTVFPVTEAVAEEFQNATQGGVKVTVGISGTGGGFKKFGRGEIDVADA